MLLFSVRPYIIVKKGQPMVKNKHIEDLSQGYRWVWESGQLLVGRVFKFVTTYLLIFVIFCTPELLKTSCTRAWWSTWMWMRRTTVKLPFMNTWLTSECFTLHGIHTSDLFMSLSDSFYLFIISAETQLTWRSSPSHCSGCVLASFPTPTTTSHPGTHTNVLWASRPWVRHCCWAGSFSQKEGHWTVKISNPLSNILYTAALFTSMHAYTQIQILTVI